MYEVSFSLLENLWEKFITQTCYPILNLNKWTDKQTGAKHNAPDFCHGA